MSGIPVRDTLFLSVPSRSLPGLPLSVSTRVHLLFPKSFIQKVKVKKEDLIDNVIRLTK